MSDDLKKRLIDGEMWDDGDINDTREEAHVYIEELLEAARRDATEAEAYAAEMEAKLAKAVEALEHAKLNMPHPDQMIDDTLAELKGETDE